MPRAKFITPLELSLDRGLVDDRPNLLDPLVAKLIEHVFRERDALPVDGKAEQEACRRAVEAKAARDARRLGNQQADIEMEVWNGAEIFLQHRAIA